MAASASMGPRPFGRGRDETCGNCGYYGQLQWGRDLSAAEGRQHRHRSPKSPASMGPRPFGRGRGKMRKVREVHGKASMGPRPFGRGRPKYGTAAIGTLRLQWGRDLSAAEGEAAASSSPSAGGFNGAATFRPRKGAVVVVIQAVLWLQWGRDLSAAEGAGSMFRLMMAGSASMGPRPFGRGRLSAGLWYSPAATCFNGAATFRPRKVAGPGKGRARPRGFNGAATFRPRKDLAPAYTNLPMQLQWGRDLSAAEGRSSARACAHWRRLQWGRDLSAAEGRWWDPPGSSGGCFNGAATFRPRKVAEATMVIAPLLLQWGRDLSAAEGCCGCACVCHWAGFNGAATFRPRKVPGAPGQSRRPSASMGPRPFGRGRPEACRQRSGRRDASMGPRPFGRGRRLHEVGQVDREFASMGPRPFGRGRFFVLIVGGTAREKLQWGRDLSAAEGAPYSAEAAALCSFNEAATFRPRKVLAASQKPDSPCGFNGAATFRPRKGTLAAGARAPKIQLQWGRDLSAAEGCLATRPSECSCPASMGPRPFGRGRSQGSRIAWNSSCFNGAATFRPRKAARSNQSLSCRSRFNGAATFRPRKEACVNAMGAMPPSFNGAATFRPRKAPDARDGEHARLVLQWGRDLSAAEGAHTKPRRHFPVAASMGPRPFGRGRY